MSTEIGYAIVSQIMSGCLKPCGAPGCAWGHLCARPERPGCHAICVHDPKLLEEHPECQEWQRKTEAWNTAHNGEQHTGGTRVGPLHYFQDCKLLLRMGPRRKDARIVAFDPETVQKLGLATCKECRSKMAHFEEQLVAGEVTV